MPVSGLVVTLKPAPGSTPAPDPGFTPEAFHGAFPGKYGASPDDSLPGLTPCAGPSDLCDPAVIEQIQQHPNFQAGPRHNHRLPVVLDTPDKETDKQCWGWLNELSGVHHVDVAFIHFEDEDALEASPCSANAEELIAAPTIGET